MELPQVNIKRILYATDLSENARYAYAYAVSLAEHYNARIIILHVTGDYPNLDAMVEGYISTERWEAIKAANMQETTQALIGKKRDNVAIREVLSQFAQETGTDATANADIIDEIVVTRGHAVDQILTQATERGCDLIIVGSRGYGALQDVVLGSTARRVIRRATLPVLAVRLPE